MFHELLLIIYRCFSRLSEHCWSNSILELWEFDGEEIDKLKSIEQVSEKLHSTTTSPLYNFEFVPSNWLADIKYDENGNIIGAAAAKMLYVLQATSTNELDNKVVVS